MGLFDGIGNFFTGAEDNKPFYAWQGIQGDLAQAAQSGMKPWLSNPAYTVAPMNQMQTAANTGALGMLGMGGSGGYSQQMADLVGQAGQYANVSAADINAYADPLADLMVERGQNALNESYGRSANDIGQRAAAGGAFGGSREAVQRGMLDESMADASKDLALGADAAAYQLGAGLAEGNAQRQMNAIGQDYSYLTGADASRLAGMGFDAQTLGLLSAFGDRQQQYDQSKLDAPYTTAMQLYGLLAGNPPQEQASGFQTLLGFLASNAGNAANLATGNIAGIK